MAGLARLRAGILKTVVEATKDLCAQANLRCDEDGVRMQALDSSHVAIVALVLSKSAFAEYRCARSTTLGVNLECLAKVLKMCQADDDLELKWRHGDDHVTIRRGTSLEFVLKLMESEEDVMQIPMMTYDATITMPSAAFQKICRDMKDIGETMTIRADAESIRFSVEDDSMGKGTAIVAWNDSTNPAESVTIEAPYEPVTSSFALRYLVAFAKASSLCGTMRLELGAETPLSVKFEVGGVPENGHLQFYLAPKVID